MRHPRFMLCALAAPAVLSNGACMLAASETLQVPISPPSPAAKSRASPRVQTAVYVADQHLAVSLHAGLGRSPLQSAAGDRDWYYSVGASYEQALSRRRPWLRLIGSGDIMGDLCASPEAGEPETECERDKALLGLELGVGIALTATESSETVRHEGWPAVAGVSARFVYSYFDHSSLGSARFAGFALSARVGFDFSEAVHSHDDD